MQIKDKRKAKAKLQATCNSYAERNSSISFCNSRRDQGLRYVGDVNVGTVPQNPPYDTMHRSLAFHYLQKNPNAFRKNGPSTQLINAMSFVEEF
jgi:hypothetical protein